MKGVIISEQLLEMISSLSVTLLEFVGVIIIITTSLRGIFLLVVKRENVRLILAKGYALALEFKLGSELIRTVTLRSFEELLLVGSIILLRAALAFLIEWELKNA